MIDIKLALIGEGIGRSRAPELHRLAGGLCGLDVTYDLIDLKAAPRNAFDAALDACRSQGFRGVNVTHPFKERVAERVHVASETVRRLGAVNTVRFDSAAKPQGFNTDYTGFRTAFATRFPGSSPGVVAIVGAGGVGRAIAFALVDLHAKEIRIFDQETKKCERLASALRAHTETAVAICETLQGATSGADGIVNATPVGMHLYPGTPIPRSLIGAQSWAFDAVYTPTETRFLQDAMDAGLETLDGYELFFQQGIDAFEVFSGIRVNEARLRDALTQSKASLEI
ncbi:MAG: shikimate dehydrogenase family protein [Burkholderiales bacterium]